MFTSAQAHTLDVEFAEGNNCSYIRNEKGTLAILSKKPKILFFGRKTERAKTAKCIYLRMRVRIEKIKGQMVISR